MSAYNASALKRFFDVVLALVVLPIALPLVLLAFLVVLIFSGGPALFIQERVGLHGKVFYIYKVRTLKNGTADPMAGMRHDDPHFITLGRLIRRWRIDELPQIWNILKGDMSWVGPRPERPEIVSECLVSLANYNQRHDCLPGITGWAQVHAPNATPEENGDKLVYDLEYVHQASFSKDLKILFTTVFVMFR
jgi:lipopolysaccharide/colanic/teichoic acid biosynthesis glycosyltransferase